MENDILPNGKFYTEEELTNYYNEGYIYFYDVVSNTENDSAEHLGYSKNFYKDLTSCVRDAYDFITKYESEYDSNNKIRFIQILGLTNLKDYEGNRLFLRLCDLSHSHLRSYDKNYISFSKDILRGEGYEKYFPHLNEIVKEKYLTDDDLNIIDESKKIRVRK